MAGDRIGNLTEEQFAEKFAPSLAPPIGDELSGTFQAKDADLDAYAALTTTGLVARTGAGTAATRTITAGTGITVNNGDGVGGNPEIVSTVTGFTDELAQDAVGTILTDTATIDFTYSDATPSITADVKDGSITLAKQANVASGTVFYRKTAAAGAPEVQTLATLKTDLGLTGTNSGDQTSIVGITGTKAQFDTAVTDGNILYVGDVTQYTDEMARDAIGTALLGTANQITVTPNDGADTITVSLPSAITTPGSLTVTTTLAANGNVTLGDATTDSHTVNGSAAMSVGANGSSGWDISDGTRTLRLSPSNASSAAIIGTSTNHDLNLIRNSGILVTLGASAVSVSSAFSCTGNATLGDAVGDTHVLNGGTVTISGNQNATTSLAITNTDITNSTSRAGLTLTAGTAGARILVLHSSIVAIGSTTANDVQLQRAGVVIGTLTSTGLDVAGAITATTSIKSSGATSGIGYATGAGGTVTQATSKSTGVTLNKCCGEITLNGAALASATVVSFVLTNSAIAATDNIVLNHTATGTFGAYLLNGRCAAGSATIDVRNVTAGSLSEAIVIRFTVIKGVTS